MSIIKSVYCIVCNHGGASYTLNNVFFKRAMKLMLRGKGMFEAISLLCEILFNIIIIIEVICKLEEQILLILRYRYNYKK